MYTGFDANIIPYYIVHGIVLFIVFFLTRALPGHIQRFNDLLSSVMFDKSKYILGFFIMCTINLPLLETNFIRLKVLILHKPFNKVLGLVDQQRPTT